MLRFIKVAALAVFMYFAPFFGVHAIFAQTPVQTAQVVYVNAPVLSCDIVDGNEACWQYDTLQDEELVYYDGIDYNTPRVLKWYPEYVFYWPYGCYDWRCGFYGHRVYVQPGVYVNRLTIVFYDPGWVILARPYGWYWWYSYREHYHYYIPYHGYWDRRVMHVHHYDSFEHRKHGWVAEKHVRFRDFKEQPYRHANVREGYRRDRNYQPDSKWRERWSDKHGKVVGRQNDKPQVHRDRNDQDRWRSDSQKKSVTRQDLGTKREIKPPNRREDVQPHHPQDRKTRSSQNPQIQRKLPTPQRQSSVDRERRRDPPKVQQHSRPRDQQKVQKQPQRQQQAPKPQPQKQQKQRNCDRGRC